MSAETRHAIQALNQAYLRQHRNRSFQGVIAFSFQLWLFTSFTKVNNPGDIFH